MAEWLVILLCFVICIVVCGIIELVKTIIKHFNKKKQVTVDFSKYEYIISGLAIIVTFGGVFAFLYVGKFIENYGVVEYLKIAGIVASSTQAVYMFFIQLLRKGISGLTVVMLKLITAFKSKKTTAEKIETIVDIVNNETEQLTSEEKNESLNDFLNNIGK